MNVTERLGTLAQARAWIFPARVTGRFQRARAALGVVLNAILFITPWVRIDGRPALLVDLSGRRLDVLGQIFTAAETYYLVIVGLFLAFLLFFVTALYGRVWCGYFCPQTVFLEQFVHRIEGWIEGDRGKRMQLDKAPWTWNKIWRRGSKYLAFAAVALAISLTMVSYFVDAHALWSGRASTASYGFVAFLGSAWMFDFAWFREQFCNYLCPYARFQGALTDDQSLVVAYDIPRGEPRKVKGLDPRVAGECVDCGKCVAVCPQGIDIRNGFQLECVNCARCIDACEGVMSKLHADGLIQYNTIAHAEGRPSQRLRPRTAVYGAILFLLATGFSVRLLGREPVQVFVQRTPGSLFQTDDHGNVRNTFLVRVTDNRVDEAAHTFHFAVDGLEGSEVLAMDTKIAPLHMTTVPLVVQIPSNKVPMSTVPIQVKITSDDGHTVMVGTTFKAPESEGGDGS